MIHIVNIRDGIDVYEALASDVRVSIIELLLKHKQMNLKDLSKQTNITNGAMTAHIKKLEKAGIIEIKSESGVRGAQKMCRLKTSKIIVDIKSPEYSLTDYYETETAVGQFTDYDVSPTCGVVTSERIVGELDDPRYFSFPERYSATLLWFARGFVEYKLPNSLKNDEVASEIQISLELAAEAPGCSSNYPSDIYFELNGTQLGYWTLPGEFNDRRGVFTPSWWFSNLGQYGKLKLLTINNEGSFIDGIQISDVTAKDLNIVDSSQITFKISSPDYAAHQGGVSIFGRGFGDYNSGILMKLFYEKKKSPINVPNI